MFLLSSRRLWFAGAAAVVAVGATVVTVTAQAAVLPSTGPAVAAAATPTTPPASYPNPGAVTGDTGTHDPSVAKTPSGGYLLAYTGPNLQLKTSSDRKAWRNAGAAFPGGASW